MTYDIDTTTALNPDSAKPNVIPICSAATLKQNDQLTQSEDGLPGIALMEHAGAEVARLALALCADIPQPKLRIFCGPGQNGGDGFVAARHLLHHSPWVSVLCACPLDRYRGDAKTQLAVLRKCGIEPIVLDTAILGLLKRDQDLEIDALLGTGTKGQANGLIGAVIHWLNEGRSPICSIDLPSGALADQGQQQNLQVHSTHVLSIGALKACQVFEPSASASGQTHFHPIGFPLHRNRRSPYQVIEAQDASCWLPRRKLQGHKGSSGKCLIWAGSADMMGAAILATKAALTTGAGMVKVLLPEGQRQVLLQHCPEALCIDISEPEPGDKDEDTALEQLMELSKWADATLVGPGLGTTAKVRQRLCPWLSQHRGPVLLDADALNALSMELGLLGKDLGSEQEASTRAGQEQRSKSVAETSQATAIHQLKKWLGPQTLLTPHRGEAQRLLAPIFGELPEAGLALMEFAQKAAQALGLQLHLKGAPALTAWSSSEVTLNSSGGPLLSTAGSGDVLAGIAAALMAQACPAAIAGALGAFIHGRCADELAKSGQRGHCAGDLCGQIGVVMSKLETGPNSTHS